MLNENIEVVYLEFFCLVSAIPKSQSNGCIPRHTAGVWQHPSQLMTRLFDFVSCHNKWTLFRNSVVIILKHFRMFYSFMRILYYKVWMHTYAMSTCMLCWIYCIYYCIWRYVESLKNLLNQSLSPLDNNKVLLKGNLTSFLMWRQNFQLMFISPTCTTVEAHVFVG